MLDRPEQPLVLVVDDTAENLELMSALLLSRYRVKVASNGATALRIARRTPQPDLILLDIMMPEMDGYEVCRQLKADPLTAPIPLIFVTALSDAADEQQGFDLGAVDYISKPVSPPLLLARVQAQLQLKASADFLRDKGEYLELEVRRRTRELERLQEVTIEAMAGLAALRENPCGRHLSRIKPYMSLLGRAWLQQQPEGSAGVSGERLERIGQAALLHDIGKLALPDRILHSPVALQGNDLRLLQHQAVAGRDALLAAEARLGSSPTFLRDAREIVYSQHEHWDGTGYPEGLRGEQIPLAARLMALVNHYEELTCPRAYRPALSHEEARALIAAASGSRFDPQVVQAFLSVEQAFASLASDLADDAAAMRGELQRLEESLGEHIELTVLPPE